MIDLYANWISRLISGQSTLSTATLFGMLVRDTFEFDPTDTTVAQIAANEIEASNYSRLALPTGLVATPDLAATPPTIRFNVPSPPFALSWTAVGAGEKIQGLVLYEGTVNPTDDASNYLVAAWTQTVGQPSFPFTTDGGDLSLTLPTSGFAAIEVPGA